MQQSCARSLALAFALLGLTACAESAHQTGLSYLSQQVSEDLRRLVDTSVSFADLQANPGSYNGKTVIFGGEVIRAKRVKDTTEVELLQLPLDADGIPTQDRSQSQGRFLTQQDTFLDPATLDAGTALTVVGTVEGNTVRPLSEGEDNYTYPMLRIIQLLNWKTLPETNVGGGWPYQYNPYAYYGPSYWGPGYYAYPFWSPWGYWGRGYWYPPPVVSPPAPSIPPGARPPQFRGSGSSMPGGSGFGAAPRSLPPQFQKRH